MKGARRRAHHTNRQHRNFIEEREPAVVGFDDNPDNSKPSEGHTRLILFHSTYRQSRDLNLCNQSAMNLNLHPTNQRHADVGVAKVLAELCEVDHRFRVPT